jgi:hypothetical protein
LNEKCEVERRRESLFSMALKGQWRIRQQKGKPILEILVPFKIQSMRMTKINIYILKQTQNGRLGITSSAL